MLSLVVSLSTIKRAQEWTKKEIKKQSELIIKDIYLELLTMSGNQQSSLTTDLSKSKADSLSIHRFLLKYNDVSISQLRIENSLIYRKINKLKSLDRNNLITYEDFFRLFLDHAKSLVYVPGTPVVPSVWNDKKTNSIRFKKEQREQFELSKSYQKEGPNKEEELLAFKKYFLAQLALD
jgi:hypothetical protein